MTVNYTCKFCKQVMEITKEIKRITCTNTKCGQSYILDIQTRDYIKNTLKK